MIPSLQNGHNFLAYFRRTEAKARRARSASRARGEEREKNNACTHTIVQAVLPPDTPLMTSQSQRWKNSGARKVHVIMARCGPNLQCFHSENGEITSLGLKMERKNTNQCLGGLRMEYQVVQSPQTFLVKNFSFLQQPRKHDDRCAFKWVLITDRGFKAASWTLENKNGNVQYYFEVEFNFWNDW